MKEVNNDVYLQCKQLVKNGAIMANLSLTNMKERKQGDKKEISKLNKLVVDLNSLNDDLEKIKKQGDDLDEDDIEYLDTALIIGNYYSKWLYKYTAELMPILEDIKCDLENIDGEERE